MKLQTYVSKGILHQAKESTCPVNLFSDVPCLPFLPVYFDKRKEMLSIWNSYLVLYPKSYYWKKNSQIRNPESLVHEQGLLKGQDISRATEILPKQLALTSNMARGFCSKETQRGTWLPRCCLKQWAALAIPWYRLMMELCLEELRTCQILPRELLETGKLCWLVAVPLCELSFIWALNKQPNICLMIWAGTEVLDILSMI